MVVKKNINTLCEKSKCEKSKCENLKYEKFARLGTCGAIFITGAMTEIYTFKSTNDFDRSTGFGWALLAIFIVC